uniref:Alcohol oxidase n=1 Tax=Ganoderma boninense TaxID=34458 RepID=A0A5K1JRZ5_9APHY|nr:Alcohol oxidase [Ganoderma boninense]
MTVDQPRQLQPISLNRSIVDGSALDPPQPPHVQPAYYAGILVNTFVGASGAAQVVELSVGDADVSGYAAFEGGRLARAVFVNMHAWLTTSTGARPAVHIDFAGRTGSAQAKRLVIQHADDTANVTFAGQSFETPGDPRPVGAVVSEAVELSKGLDVRATEAVLVEFD